MKINRKEMISHLLKVMPGVETGTSILEGADTFEFTEDGIFSYNDIIAVSVPVQTGIVGAVKSKEFFNLLSKLKEDEFTLIQKKDTLIIKCGSVRAKIKLVVSATLDYLNNLDIANLEWSKVESSLIDAFRLCKLNSSNSPIRGIYVNGDVCYSTDEIRIANAALAVKYDTFWIDDSAAAELLKIADGLKKISVGNGWVHFKSKDASVFSCKTNNAEIYPFMGLLEKKLETQKKKKDPTGKLPTSFKEAIERVSVLSEDLNGFSVVNMTFTKDELIISSHKDAGSVEEIIPWDEPLEIKNEISTSGDAGFLIEAVNKSFEFYITKNGDDQFIVFTKDRFCLMLSTIK